MLSEDELLRVREENRFEVFLADFDCWYRGHFDGSENRGGRNLNGTVYYRRQYQSGETQHGHSGRRGQRSARCRGGGVRVVDPLDGAATVLM